MLTSEEARLLIQLMSVKGVGPVLATRILHGLARSRMTLREAVATEKGIQLLQKWLKTAQLQSLFQPNERVANQVTSLLERDTQFLNISDSNYPQLLKTSLETPPPLLTLRGNISLLNQIGVGFCGSRSASDKGIGVAQDIADQLARQEVVVVSGHAAGVDQAAHHAALEAGGNTIIVLPEGMLHFKPRKLLQKVWDWQRVLVLSEFLPGATWSAGQAMQRNKTIVALSSVMVLIEAGETGGSMAAGKSALAMKRPLYAPVYAGMPPTAAGNRLLLGLGAKGLMRKQTTNRANLENLVNELAVSCGPGLHSPLQLAL